MKTAKDTEKTEGVAKENWQAPHLEKLGTENTALNPAGQTDDGDGWDVYN
jgi:hypothetical protein